MLFADIPGKPVATAIFLTAFCLFFSCKKTDTVNIPAEQPADFSKKVTASVNGFVTDEYDKPVMNAAVKYGDAATATDKYGYFKIDNAAVTANAAFVTVTMNGYFNGIKTFITSEGRTNFCSIKLIPKSITGTIDADKGGMVTLNNGLKVSLLANAVINAATNAAYSGTVNVSSYWLDPGVGINNSMPGASWGIDKNGSLRALKNYGMAAVELRGASAELLQIAPGKKATLTIPIPQSVLASAPGTIPLWYLDETKGYCKEEGFATKDGDSYVGEVGHFTYWYCFHPQLNMIDYLKCKITDSLGNPIRNVGVGIWSKWMGIGYTGTDNDGIVYDYIPSDVYQLDVLDNSCTAYSVQNFLKNPVLFTGYQHGTLYDIGTLILPQASVITIKGNVINCSGLPVNNGFVMFRKGWSNYRAAISNTGTFSIVTTFCTGTSNISLIAEDADNLIQSNNYTFTPLNYGINDVGTFRACDISAQEYFNYTIDGKSYSFIYPDDGFGNDYNSIGAYNTDGYVMTKSVNFLYKLQNNITPGTEVPLLEFNSFQPGDTLQTNNIPSVVVHFSEFGAVNEFMGGYFSGTFNDPPPSNTSHNISCNFRVRRNF